jgi:hypothetical protein
LVPRSDGTVFAPFTSMCPATGPFVIVMAEESQCPFGKFNGVALEH